MFKKFSKEEVSGFSQVKSSVSRGIRGEPNEPDTLQRALHASPNTACSAAGTALFTDTRVTLARLLAAAFAQPPSASSTHG